MDGVYEGAEERAWRIMGRVQGVGFRWWTRETAGELSLSGWVRNESDGSVTVKARGATEALEALAERLKRGPPAAQVQGAERVPPESVSPGVGSAGGFRIRR